MSSLAGKLKGLLGTSRERDTRPLVSVIVPFYNVEGYLSECLQSVLDQSISSLEVIAVDDGSTDRSAKVAMQFAGDDDRLTLLSQGNAGPGAARNLALSHAKGTYLAFVDSDDRLPVDALKMLVQSAQKNNADIVVGAIRRFNSTRSWVPRWVKGVHSSARAGVQLAAVPELLRNNYPVGKVFRTDFWRKQRLAFREGVIYEDQPLIAQMYLRASRINVLTNVTYDYRAREDRSSISQRPEEIADLRDRVEAWQLTVDTLRKEAPEAVLNGWYETVYGTHLHWYLNSDSISDPEYWSTLRASLLALRKYEPASALDKLTAEKRVALLLLAADEQDEMVAFRNAGGYDLGKFPTEPTADGLRHELPVPNRLVANMPPDVLVSPVRELGLRQQLLRGGWTEKADRRVLHLGGHAYIPFLDLTTEATRIGVFARDTSSGNIVNATVEPCDDLALRSLSNTDVADYVGSEYSAEFNVDELARVASERSRWKLFVRVSTAALTVTEPLGNLSGKGGLGEASALALDSNHRLRLVSQSNRHVGVEIVIERPRLVVDNVVLHGRELVLAFRSTGQFGLVALHFEAEGFPGSCRVPVGSTAEDVYEVEVTIPELGTDDPQGMISWTVRAEDTAGRLVPLSWADGRLHQVPIGTGTLRAYSSATGNFKLEEYPRGCVVVTRLARKGEGVEVFAETIVAVGWDVPRLAPNDIVTVARTAPQSNDGHSFSALLVTGDATAYGTETVSGCVGALTRAQAGCEVSVPVMLCPSVLLQLPMAVSDFGASAERARARSLSIRLAKVQ